MAKQKMAAKTPRLRFPQFIKDGDWALEKLGSVASLVSDKVLVSTLNLDSYVSTENLLPDYGDMVPAAKLPDVASVTRFERNDVLISNIRPYLKKVWRSDRDGGASNDVIVVRAKETIHRRFLSVVLRNDAFITYVMGGAKGVKMPRGDIGAIRKYPIGYPAPAEQQKIADCLTSLDEVIAAQGRKVEALKAHKRGLMQQLFPREGETRPRLRFPEFRDAPEWREISISDIGEVITGSTPATSRKDYYGGAHLFVSPADISDSRFVETTKTNLTEAGFAQARVVKARSVLFVCIGSTIGKVGQNVRDCATNQQINAIVTNSEFLGDFVYCMLDMESERIAGLAGRQAVPIINKTLFSSVKVLAPKIGEQHRIADCLSSLDTQITAESNQLAALKTHKQGLMQQLFPAPEAASA